MIYGVLVYDIIKWKAAVYLERLKSTLTFLGVKM